LIICVCGFLFVTHGLHHATKTPLFILVNVWELKQIEEISDEVLLGGDGSKGLADFLTVYSDGRVNISDAPAEVVASLDEGLNNRKTIELLIKALEDPEARVPGYVSNLARRLKDSVTTDSRSYRAKITLGGGKTSRRVEIAVRKVDDDYQVVLFNEMDEPHEQFEQ